MKNVIKRVKSVKLWNTELLKELKIHKQNLFCVRHKNRRKHSQHFKLLFFTINLHFVTSNQIPIYIKPNLVLTSSIYLVFFPLEMQGRLKQTKLYHKFFILCDRNDHKPLKVVAAKTASPVCVCYWYNLLR